MLLTLGATILVIGVLIFVHELGHFMAAKAVGIGVPRFSIGLGPVTPLTFRRGETEYVISWIPFGGYVKMASREEQEEAMANLEGGAAVETFPAHKLFENKPLWARILVISAGVTMNFLFAWVAYLFIGLGTSRVEIPATAIASVDTTILPESARALAALPPGTQLLRINGDSISSWNDVRDVTTEPTSTGLRFEFIGYPSVEVPIDGFDLEERVDLFRALIPQREARLGQIVEGSAADEAGFEVGDLIVRIDADTVPHWQRLVELVSPRPGEPLDVVVIRDGAPVELAVVTGDTVRVDPITETEERVGVLGVFPSVRTVRFGFGESVASATRRLGSDSKLILVTLQRLITGRVSPRELGGPVLIGQISGQVAQQGFVPLLAFMALFSVNLAILNLLPIPVLDGGQLVFLIIEGIRGQPMPLELRIRFSQVGLMILLGIMALALTNDLLRVFGL